MSQPPQYQYVMFIDDERQPASNPASWLPEGLRNAPLAIVRNFNQAKEWFESRGCPAFISFDHDLRGTLSQTGYDIAKLLVQMDVQDKLKVGILEANFQWYVHSQNPVGAQNINQFLHNYIDHIRQK